jgi:hypothetical protein
LLTKIFKQSHMHWSRPIFNEVYVHDRDTLVRHQRLNSLHM